MVEPAGERHAVGNREALAQRTSGHVHARGIGHVGVALQVRAILAQGDEVLTREVTALGEGRVQRRRRMALREHQTVTLGIVGVLGVDVHLVKIEHRQDVGAGKRAARVAGACRSERLDDVNAKLVCDCLEVSGHIQKSPFVGVGDASIRNHFSP